MIAELGSLLMEPTTFPLVAFLLGVPMAVIIVAASTKVPLKMIREWIGEVEEFSSQNLPQHPAIQHPASRYGYLTNEPCHSCGALTRRVWVPALISFATGGFRCSQCGSSHHIRPVIIESLTLALTMITALLVPPGLELALILVLTWTLITMSVIDYDHQLLPDSLTYPVLWAGLGINLFGVFVDLEVAVIGAMAGYASLWCLFWGFKLTTGREGMGFGDFKLLAALGAWFGYEAVLIIALVSAALFVVVGVISALRKGESNPSPFGPYLAIGGWLVGVMPETMHSLLLGAPI